MNPSSRFIHLFHYRIHSSLLIQINEMAQFGKLESCTRRNGKLFQFCLKYENLHNFLQVTHPAWHLQRKFFVGRRIWTVVKERIATWK